MDPAKDLSLLRDNKNNRVSVRIGDETFCTIRRTVAKKFSRTWRRELAARTGGHPLQHRQCSHVFAECNGCSCGQRTGCYSNEASTHFCRQECRYVHCAVDGARRCRSHRQTTAALPKRQPERAQKTPRPCHCIGSRPSDCTYEEGPQRNPPAQVLHAMLDARVRKLIRIALCQLIRGLATLDSHASTACTVKRERT